MKLLHFFILPEWTTKAYGYWGINEPNKTFGLNKSLKSTKFKCWEGNQIYVVHKLYMKSARLCTTKFSNFLGTDGFKGNIDDIVLWNAIKSVIFKHVYYSYYINPAISRKNA